MGSQELTAAAPAGGVPSPLEESDGPPAGAARRHPGPGRTWVLVRFWAGLVSLAAVTAAATLLTLAVIPVVLPGWSSVTVGSGSMTPALRVGDVVLLRTPTAGPALRSPSVVLVDRGPAEPLLHRVVDYTEGTGYTTRGDANLTSDSDPVPRDAVLGVARVVVPGVGWPILWAQRHGYLPLLGAALALGGLLRLARYGWCDRYDPWGPAAPPRPSRRRLAHPVPVLGIGLALLSGGLAGTGLTGMPNAAAAFSATAGNTANSLLADSLAPVTGLTATTNCPSTTRASLASITFGSASSSTVRVTVPTSARAGDLLVVHIARDSATITPPAGFTAVRTDAVSNLAGFVYQRVATATDPGTAYTWTVSGSAGSGMLLTFRNSAGLILTAEASGSAATSATAVTAPSVSAGAANSMLLFLSATTGSNPQTPTGMTSTGYTSTANGVTLTSYTQALTSTGPTGSRSAPLGTAGAVAGENVLIRPALPTVDLDWTSSGSTYATGYAITRNGVPVATLTGRTTSTWTDTSTTSGTHTWTVTTTSATTWRSTAATATTTVTC